MQHQKCPSLLQRTVPVCSGFSRQNSSFEESGIEKSLIEAENVVIFGHSLGITDSDYFDDFFLHIGTSKCRCKRIYIVTLDTKSFCEIIESAKEWGINWDSITQNAVKVIPVYTSLGTNQQNFKEMLSML